MTSESQTSGLSCGLTTGAYQIRYGMQAKVFVCWELRTLALATSERPVVARYEPCGERSAWHGRRTGGESPLEGPDDGNLLTEGKGRAPRGVSNGSRRCNDELN